MQSIFPTRAERDYLLLQQFLCENLYDKADALYDADLDDLIEYCFRNYYMFLAGSHTRIEYYKLFQREAYRMLALRGETELETEYRMRSSRFVQFAQNLLASTKNESLVLIPPSASTPGDELTHVTA